MSANTREVGRIPTDGKLAYKGIASAAEAVEVSESTIRRALQNTDPKVYPPPLISEGRHGKRGPRAFLASTLTEWVISLSTFEDD